MPTTAVPMADVRQLQAAVQLFVRRFGLLVTKQTPCGHPVSPSYAHALMILLEYAGSATTQSELGNALGIDKSNVARLCARMHEQGHAVQKTSPEDGRGRQLNLTPKGRRTAEQIRNASLERFQHVLRSIPAAKREQLFESLELLNVAVAALDGAAS